MNCKVILRSVHSNKLYEHNGGDNYTNLFTGQSGEILPEKAQRMFIINVEATVILNENTCIKDLIQKLGLVIEK